MNRKEILAWYDVNEHGIITSPGKFEAEMLYAVHFWDLTLESREDEIVYDGDTPLSIFHISSEDKTTFPELDGVEYISLYEDSQGFVYCLEWESEKEMRKELAELASFEFDV